MFWRMSSHTALRVSKFLSLNSCVIIILWGSIWRCVCKFLLTLLSDIPKEAALNSAVCLGDCWIDKLTPATFSGVVTIKGRPDDSFFSTEPVAFKFDTQSWIVFLFGTGEIRRISWHRIWNVRWVVIAEPPLRIYSSTTRARDAHCAMPLWLLKMVRRSLWIYTRNTVIFLNGFKYKHL